MHQLAFTRHHCNGSLDITSIYVSLHHRIDLSQSVSGHPYVFGALGPRDVLC